MSERNGVALINAKFDEGKNVCVGLDTEHERIPEYVLPIYDRKVGVGPRVRMFNADIVKATANIAGAYKYNLGFYLAQGQQGFWALQFSIEDCRACAPDVPIILDGKFGDVGLSAKQYAKFAFEVLGVDALTVNPWGGYEDGLDAFFEYKDKMIFVWCGSSNKGANELQDKYILPARQGFFDAMSVSEYIAYLADEDWNGNNNCGLVVGATEDWTLKFVRKFVGDEMPILVPGIGAQGGDLEAAVKAAGPRTLFNSSRGIIYASSGPDFAEAARKEVIALQSRITEIMEAMKR